MIGKLVLCINLVLWTMLFGFNINRKEEIDEFTIQLTFALAFTNLVGLIFS